MMFVFRVACGWWSNILPWSAAIIISAFALASSSWAWAVKISQLFECLLSVWFALGKKKLVLNYINYYSWMVLSVSLIFHFCVHKHDLFCLNVCSLGDNLKKKTWFYCNGDWFISGLLTTQSFYIPKHSINNINCGAIFAPVLFYVEISVWTSVLLFLK